MDKVLKIVFSKTAKSKNLPEALKLAKKLGAVIEDDSVRVELSINEVFNLWEWINGLLFVIDKWRSFEIYYKNRLCVVNKEYRQLFYALQDIRSCYHETQDDPSDFEKCNDAWGCHKLSFISLGLKDPGIKKWYQWGHLVEPDTWMVHKQQLYEEVRQEISRKHLRACPAFPHSRIKKVIEQLPDSFKLDEFWWIDFKYEMIQGEVTKVAKSVWYTGEFEKDWMVMDNLLAVVNKPIECPYEKGSDEWIDWMTERGYFKPN